MTTWLPETDENHLDEYQRCATDPVYWISHWCTAYDPREIDDPFRPFVPWSVQIDFLRWLQERDKTASGGLVEKSRDSGATYLCAYYALHCWLFRTGDATGFGSRKLDLVDELGNPSSIFEKIRMTYRQLPEWMQPKGFIWSKHSTQGKLINPDNGSTIIGEGGDDIGRGGRCSRYFVDEAAHIEHPKMIDASLSQNTRVRIDLSTPRGLNEFYRKRTAGNVARFRLHWIDDERKNRWEERDAAGNVVGTGNGRHPTAPIPTAYESLTADVRGVTVVWPWYEGPDARMKPEYADPAILAQEVDIDYVGSGNPRFNRKYLQDRQERICPAGKYTPATRGSEGRITHPGYEPIRVELAVKTSWAGDLTTFADPVQGQSYVLVVDSARGLTESGTADYSVAHVFDLETCEQAAHYRGRMSETEYAIDLDVLGRMYNNALIVVETPGPGEAVLSWLINQCKYRNIYYYRNDDERRSMKPVKWGEVQQPSGPKQPGLLMGGDAYGGGTKAEGDGKLASMIEDAAAGIPGSLQIRHYNTLEECYHYVRLRRYICGAEAGGHDDEVSCLRLLAMVWGQYTMRGKQSRSLVNLVPRPPQTSYSSMGKR